MTCNLRMKGKEKHIDPHLLSSTRKQKQPGMSPKADVDNKLKPNLTCSVFVTNNQGQNLCNFIYKG